MISMMNLTVDMTIEGSSYTEVMTAPRHGKVPPRGESKSSQTQAMGWSKVKPFRAELFHDSASSGWS